MSHLFSSTTSFRSGISGLLGQANNLQPVPPGSNPTGPAGGDLTGTYPNPDLTSIGGATGTFGNATNVPVVTRDAKGRITAITQTPITFPPLPVIGVAAGPIGNATTVPVVTKDAEGRVTALTSQAIAFPPLPTIGAAIGPIGSATTVPVVTRDAQGRVTALTSATITGVPSAPSGPAGGALNGTYPNPNVTNLNVLGTQVAVGQGAVSSATNAVALGVNAQAAFPNTVAIGPNCVAADGVGLNFQTINPVVSAPVVIDRYVVINVNGQGYRLPLQIEPPV